LDLDDLPQDAAAEGREHRRVRTGRNLPVAIGVGLVLGAGVLLTLYTVKATFLIYMAVAVGIAGWELNHALTIRGIRLALTPLACGCAAIWCCAYWLGTRSALAGVALTAIALIIWRLPRGPAGYLRDITASVFVLAYLPVMAVFAVLMLASRDGPDRLLFFIAVTVCNDIGGYFAGILFGRHPLVPAISPKKTWEGLGGSLLVCVVVGAALMPVVLGGRFWQGMILGVAAVGAATLGDLTESMIKRDLEIKDMGSFLPGHGGLLDRLDSLLINAPVAWLLLAAFVPAGAH
jgi:phosphatidate cytidylyltransferase